MPLASPAEADDDVAETARLVEAYDRRIVTVQADVRDFDALSAAAAEGVAQLGHLDIVVANAGMWSYGLTHELSEQAWQTVIDIVLTGVWHTTKATIPHLLANGDTGGSIILTSSVAGLKAYANTGHYVAAKHGVVGLMRTIAYELAGNNIRVNTVNPSSVNTDLIQNPGTYELFAPDLAPEQRTRESLIPRFESVNLMKTPWVEPEGIANAVLWLASNESRFVTGQTIVVDAGLMVK